MCFVLSLQCQNRKTTKIVQLPNIANYEDKTHAYSFDDHDHHGYNHHDGTRAREGYRHCAPAPVYHHRPHHYAARPVHVVYEPVPVPAPRPCPPPAYYHTDPAGVVAGAVVGTALGLMIGSLAY